MTERPSGRDLEPDRETMEAWLEQVGRYAIEHIVGLADAPAAGEVGAAGIEIAQRVSRSMPEAPLEGGLAQALRVLDEAVSASLTAPGPGYLAYIPGGGIYASALADFLACVVNRYTGLAAASPALVQLEADVIAWFAREFGYGPDARGLLTSGGSLSIFSAVVTARETRLGHGADLRRATAYTSSQAHHAVQKAVALAGIPAVNVRSVPVDRELRMDIAALTTQLREDRDAGLCPFLVVAAAGTTNTGAVDPLPQLADLTTAQELWLHIDGAYGGAFVLCDEGRLILSGIERADSITFDPHKGLFLPYGTGCLLVRNGEHLRAAHQADAGYLQDFDQTSALAPSPMDYGPELSRDYRGLRVWLPLMVHGAGAFRAALQEKLALAADVERRLRAVGGIEIAAPRDLSVVAFRSERRHGESREDWNQRNRQWMADINARNRVYLSSTMLGPADAAAYTLRVCVLSVRTHREQIEACIEDIVATHGAGGR